MYKISLKKIYAGMKAESFLQKKFGKVKPLNTNVAFRRKHSFFIQILS